MMLSKGDENHSQGATTRVEAASRDCINDNQKWRIDSICAQYEFGPAAFASSGRRLGEGNPDSSRTSTPVLCSDVAALFSDSVRGVKSWRGQRGAVPVTTMVQRALSNGLFMFGGPKSPINVEIIPAIQFILSEMSQLEPSNSRRVSILTSIAESCLDCQQVQARVILKIYSDLTAQTLTMEDQLSLSLNDLKEVALQRVISRRHAETCDKGYQYVQPYEQRAHLMSAYLVLVGEQLGMCPRSIIASRGDRFLPDALEEVNQAATASLTYDGSPQEDAVKKSVVTEVTLYLSVQEWVKLLLSDINNQNQVPDSERLINCDLLYDFAQKTLSSDKAYDVFYQEDRKHEYADLHPNQPIEANKYKAFLSPHVLCNLLEGSNMLVKCKSK